MVQLGVTSPESQKEQELKKPIVQDVVVVTVTAPSTVRKQGSCCTRRVILGVAIVSILVALVLGGTALGLYLRHRYYPQCIDWGCGDNDMNPPLYFGESGLWPSSYSDSASVIFEPYPSADHFGGRDGDGRDGHDGDRHGHDGDRHGHDGDRHGHDGDRHDGDGDRHDGDGDHRDGDHHDGDMHGDGERASPRPVYRR